MAEQGPCSTPKLGFTSCPILVFSLYQYSLFFKDFRAETISVFAWPVCCLHGKCISRIFPSFMDPCLQYSSKKTIQDVPDDFPSFRSSWIHHQGAVPSTMPNINASTVAEVLTLEPTCKAAAIKPRGVQKKGGTLFGEFFRVSLRIFFGFLFPICSI